MKKAMFSLPLVIPLVALMSAPAGAHNQMCCCPEVPASEPPVVAPECKTVSVPPVDARCTDARDKSDFCGALGVGKDNEKTFKYRFDAKIGRCLRTATELDEVKVLICAPKEKGNTVCPTACPINR